MKIKAALITLILAGVMAMMLFSCNTPVREYKVRTSIINRDEDDCRRILTIREMDAAYNIGDTILHTEDTSMIIVGVVRR